MFFFLLLYLQYSNRLKIQLRSKKLPKNLPEIRCFCEFDAKKSAISEDGDVDVVESEELSPDKKQGDNEKSDNEEEHEEGRTKTRSFRR